MRQFSGSNVAGLAIAKLFMHMANSKTEMKRKRSVLNWLTIQLSNSKWTTSMRCYRGRHLALAAGTLVSVLLLAACINSSANGSIEMESQEQIAISLLVWLDSADAVLDAGIAIDQGRAGLLSMGGRGVELPGIAPEQVGRYTHSCGVSVLPGTTDVVRGAAHLAYLQRARGYAETYNKIIAQYCSPD